VHVMHHGAFSNALGRVERQQSEATGLVTLAAMRKTQAANGRSAALSSEWRNTISWAKSHAEAFGVLLLVAAVGKALLR
jgi:hypothetical protein